MLLEIHDFYCTMCGTRGIPVQRKNSSLREAGHLKKIWCCSCKAETNHVECGNGYSYDDFLLEFHAHNFVGGVRQIPFKKIKEENNG